MRTTHIVKLNPEEIEILADALSSKGVAGVSTTKLAEKILGSFQLFEIPNVLDEDLKALGATEAQIRRVRSALRLSERINNMLAFSMLKKQMTSSEMIYDFIIKNKEAFPFNGSAECFFAIGLTIRQTVKGVSMIGKGSHSEVTISLPHLAREVIKLDVPRVIIVHNHPSGDVSPSDSDVNLTRKVKEVMDTLGLELLDHIIVGQGKHFSFSDRNMMPY